jgi:hypothetical protein
VAFDEHDVGIAAVKGSDEFLIKREKQPPTIVCGPVHCNYRSALSVESTLNIGKNIEKYILMITSGYDDVNFYDHFPLSLWCFFSFMLPFLLELLIIAPLLAILFLR